MGRPKGSKNRSTILREAQEAMVARGLLGHEQDFLDSLAVMEEGMRHFYVRAMAAKQTKQPDKVIDAAMIQAVQIAEKVAPYRHARLSAVRLAGDPNNPLRFKDDATADELREEIMHHLGVPLDGGVLDLGELLAPKRRIAN
jgi:hypothetical protein